MEGNARIAQEMYNLLEHQVEEALRKAVPRSSRAREYIWWSDEVDGAVRARREALQQFRNTGLNADGEVYEEAKRFCKEVIREAKRRSWEDFCPTLDPNTPDSAVW